MKVAKHSLEYGKTFCLNLGAEFIVQIFKAQVIEAIEYSDFVFGNDAEALKLSISCGFGLTDVAAIAERIAQLPYRKSGNKKRTVVISQGAEPVVVCHGGEGARLFPVVPLAPELIIDTTCGGDAFVGGFLAQMVNGKTVEECVRCGQWAAEIVIQRIGCTFPEECTYF